MYSKKDIESIKNAIVEIAEPKKIILFGSYAYGMPDAGSDVDMLVLKDSDNAEGFDIKEEAELNFKVLQKKLQMNKRIKTDIFLMTENQAKDSAQRYKSSMADALEKGKVIYERND